jgi:hypothetical protein
MPHPQKAPAHRLVFAKNRADFSSMQLPGPAPFVESFLEF